MEFWHIAKDPNQAGGLVKEGSQELVLLKLALEDDWKVGLADNLLEDGLGVSSKQAACLEGWKNGEHNEYKMDLNVQSYYVGWVLSPTK